MTALRLLKLLYIADRETLVERARPITGDRVVAMDHRPVLSAVCNLIKGKGDGVKRWQEFFRTKGRDIALVGNPDVGSCHDLK